MCQTKAVTNDVFWHLQACSRYMTYYSGWKAASLKMGSICFSYYYYFGGPGGEGVDFRSYADWFAAPS